MKTSTWSAVANSAASALHDKADSLASGKVARAAHATADVVQAGAEYLDRRDLSELLADLRGFARRHPGGALLISAAAGFLLARSLRR